MNVSIVIPNFNGEELLKKNLPYLLAAKTNKKNNIKEIIIVDDASEDGSVNFLRDKYAGKVNILVNAKNNGFSVSVNRGVKDATGDLICLINTDVVVSKNFLETINEDFIDEKVFAVSLHEDGYGYAIGKFKEGFIIHEGRKESANVESSFWASGGSAVFRKEIWDELGGMDERTLSPFYFEDLDLSYRAQKRGYKIIWDPRAKVVHNHESTMRNLNQKYLQSIKERNYLLFNWKNLTSRKLIVMHYLFLLKKIVFHPGYIRVILAAFKKYDQVVESRKSELKEATINDEKVFQQWM